jgi:hypothetical protein
LLIQHCQVKKLIESGDQREEHNSGQTVSLDALKDFGLTYEHIPVDDAGKWESEIGELKESFRVGLKAEVIDAFAKERGYKNVCL